MDSTDTLTRDDPAAHGPAGSSLRVPTGPRLIRRASQQRPRALVASLVAVTALLGGLVAVSPKLALVATVVAVAAILFYGNRGPRVPYRILLLHLLVLSMFFESVGVGPLSVGRLLAAVAVIAVVARFMLSRAPLPERLPIRVMPVLCLLTLYVISGFWASYTGAWLFALGQLALAVAFY